MKWLDFLEPERLKFVWSSLAGSMFYGLYALAAVVMAGHAPTRWDVIRAATNVICSILAGALVAYCLGSGLASMVPWKTLSDASAIGFAIGAFTWELGPLAFKAAKQWGAKTAKVS